MKKHIILAIRYTFYLAALLFFDEEVRIIPALLLISILFLENKYYSFLPLILAIYFKPVYMIILFAGFLYHIILYSFLYKNRYYSLIIYLISILTANIICLINNCYEIKLLYISCISILFYGILSLFFVYYHKGNRHYTIVLNDTLLHLTILLMYFLLIFFFNPNKYLYYFLFSQLFIFNEVVYNILFFLFSILFELIIKKSINNIFLNTLAISIFPPFVSFDINYNNKLHILLMIYSAILLLIKINKKRTTMEADYIPNLFKDFKNYVSLINKEYLKLSNAKKIKDQQLEYIQKSYCNKCNENSICRYKLDKRYSFLSNAIINKDNNIYYCPHYENFYLNLDYTPQSNIEISALVNLADELEYLYNQNLKLSKLYNKFIQSILFYDYNILDVEININTPTIFFTLKLDKNKQIIKEIFLKASYKAFKEALEIKVIENKNEYIIYIYKKPKVKLDYSHKILAKNENIISGDNYYIKKDYNDSYVFALSDGMGQGHQAYLESTEALKLISHLSMYHFSTKTILKLLEEIYDLKCDYDSYATLDILNINTSNMKLNLYKLGSSTTYIYHDKSLKTFENKALPLKFDDLNSSYEMEYFKNDVIILFSDGISDYLTKDELELINYTNNSEKIVNDIISKLKDKEKTLKDDASIIAIKIV